MQIYTEMYSTGNRHSNTYRGSAKLDAATLRLRQPHRKVVKPLGRLLDVPGETGQMLDRKGAKHRA